MCEYYGVFVGPFGVFVEPFWTGFPSFTWSFVIISVVENI